MNLCHHCDKPIEVPSRRIAITCMEYSKVSEEAWRTVQHQSARIIGGIEFHAKCFFEIAGNEYEKALDQQRSNNEDIHKSVHQFKIDTIAKTMEAFHQQREEMQKKMKEEQQKEMLEKMYRYP